MVTIGHYLCLQEDLDSACDPSWSADPCISRTLRIRIIQIDCLSASGNVKGVACIMIR